MKLKLEIQRFNSTNQTTHYDLSQYTANDKPTYLIDYNGDMAKIDTAIYGADARSLVNTGAIGDLTTLDTTAKSDLVSAVNEVNTQVETNTGNISTNTSNISTLSGNIGTMTNLTTTDKSSLVNAVNEVNAVNGTQQTAINKNTNDISDLYAKFNLTDITKYTTGTISTGTLSYCDITVATNSDKSICKIYGQMGITNGSNATVTFPTNFTVSEEFTVDFSGYVIDTTNYSVSGRTSITFKTNGNIVLNTTATPNKVVMYNPFVIFVTNFGD